MRSLSVYLRRFLENTRDRCLRRYFSNLTEIRIVQIGANDGERLDPVVSLIRRFNCKAILAEPIPVLCERLKDKYQRNPHVKILEKAITPQNNQGSLPFFHFERKVGLPFNDDYMLWGSFSMEHLNKFKNAVPHFNDLVTCSMIQTTGINDLLFESGFEQVDYLQVDAEGYDEQLISAIDLNHSKPFLIRFEHIHSNRQKVFGLLEKLSEAGYLTFSLGMDTLCITGPGKSHFRILSILKLLHANWLVPSKQEMKLKNNLLRMLIKA